MTKVKVTPAADISWLRLPAAELTPEAEASLAATIDMIGYIRHQQDVSAHRPGFLAALGALAGSILRDPTSDISLFERELIALVVSAENRCDACVVAHKAALRALGAEEYWAELVAINYRRVTMNARERALSDYAVKLTRAANEVEPHDLDALREAGISETGILDAVAVIGLFNLTNRLNSGLGIKVNREAHDSFPGKRTSPPIP